MLKKNVLITLIAASSLHAVTLKNGLEVSHKSIQATLTALKYLYATDKIGLLAHLDRGVNTPDFKIPEAALFQSANDISADINCLWTLGLCDKDGNIQANTAAIIQLSLRVGYKGANRCGPIWAQFHSPISFKNYFLPSYWLNFLPSYWLKRTY